MIISSQSGSGIAVDADAKQFTFKADAKAFRSLSAKIYTKPITAIEPELSDNA